MAFVRKIKASLVKQDIDSYVGESTYLFYDIVTGDLRIHDGSPGGLALLSGGGAATNWGTIGGSLVNQTDLQAALDAAGSQAWGTITGNIVDQTDLSTALGTAGDTALWGNITGTLADQTDLQLAIDNATITTWGSVTGTLLNQTDLITYIDNASPATTWGDVTGDITNQTDLTTYIDNATEEEMFAQQIDFISDDLLYRGEAQPGTPAGSALWRIRRITIDNAGEGDVVTTWAGGNDNFDKIWNDRLILSYS